MQGLLVWTSLPMNDVKRAINEKIGMDDLCKDDGMDKVLRLLKMIERKRVRGFLKARRSERF